MNRDTKYGRVVTEYGQFIDNEPVMVFRARDDLVIPMLENYKELCKQAGSPSHHIEAIEENISRITAWQKENQNKVIVPRSDNYAKRIGRFGLI